MFWESKPDGSAVVRPVPDATALFGIAGDGKPKDLREMQKAEEGIATFNDVTFYPLDSLAKTGGKPSS